MPVSGETGAGELPVGPPSVWNIANALTVLRIALVPLFAWLLLREDGADVAGRLLATAAFVVAIVTDRFDGDLARKRNLVTNFGKIADPIADKALTGAAFIGLSWLGQLGWWVTVLVMVREWGVTLLRFWVIRYGVMPASRGGKAKTVLQAIALGLYLLPWQVGGVTHWWGTLLHWAAVSTMAVAVVVTVVTGMDYVGRALRLRAAARGRRAR
jgi:CDP-diacylglycerol--glycerol-3-phosphate 3-phosphatidyltransferase